jgi:hypothetical protein
MATQYANRPKKEVAAPRPLMGQLRDMQLSDSAQTKFVRYMLFVAVFGIFYIANTHYADRKVRTLNKLHKEVDELRTDFMTLKAKNLIEGKRSEIRKRVEQMGLGESTEVPYQIQLKK